MELTYQECEMTTIFGSKLLLDEDFEFLQEFLSDNINIPLLTNNKHFTNKLIYSVLPIIGFYITPSHLFNSGYLLKFWKLYLQLKMSNYTNIPHIEKLIIQLKMTEKLEKKIYEYFTLCKSEGCNFGSVNKYFFEYSSKFYLELLDNMLTILKTFYIFSPCVRDKYGYLANRTVKATLHDVLEAYENHKSIDNIIHLWRAMADLRILLSSILLASLGVLFNSTKMYARIKTLSYLCKTVIPSLHNALRHYITNVEKRFLLILDRTDSIKANTKNIKAQMKSNKLYNDVFRLYMEASIACHHANEVVLAVEENKYQSDIHDCLLKLRDYSLRFYKSCDSMSNVYSSTSLKSISQSKIDINASSTHDAAVPGNDNSDIVATSNGLSDEKSWYDISIDDELKEDEFACDMTNITHENAKFTGCGDYEDLSKSKEFLGAIHDKLLYDLKGHRRFVKADRNSDNFASQSTVITKKLSKQPHELADESITSASVFMSKFKLLQDPSFMSALESQATKRKREQSFED